MFIKHPFLFTIIFVIMIAIDNILISDEIIQEHFVCDLQQCKGGCCVDGDAGAPVTENEMKQLDKIYDTIEPYLTSEGKKEIEQNGRYRYDKTFGWVTPTINNGMCAYVYKDASGIVKCNIEKAYNDKKINWKKPISCHLFPIKISQSEDGENQYVNYEPRETLCKPACKLGSHLKMPVYIFLKEALIRRFGQEFYTALENIAQQYF